MPAFLALGLLVTCLIAAPAHAQPPERTTVVAHGESFTVAVPDDICGSRASVVTFTFRTQLLHVMEHSDGGFNFQYTETGTYHVDFVDPALGDQDSQFTGSTHHVRTRSATDVISLTWHDFPSGVKIWQQLHLTVVDGEVAVNRFVQRVTGCP